MSFEVKYDSKGNVISPNPVAEQPEQPLFPTQPEEPQDIVEEMSEEVYAQPVQQPEPPKQDNVQENMRRLREKAEAAERERDELRRQLEARNQPQQPEEDLSININDDDLVEGRTLSKVDKKLRKLEQELAAQKAYNSQLAIEQRLKAQYPDFNEVVSVANVNKLATDYPEILQTLRSGSDLYAQGVSAYTMIKKLGIVPDESMDAIAKLRANSTKPRAMASLSPQQGNSPLAKANPFAEGLTEDLKAALLKEMNDAARRA